MTIKDLGITEDINKALIEIDIPGLMAGRVMQEHRERYIISTGDHEYEAEITGNLRFTAATRSDFPVVGDWVAVQIYEPDLAVIHRILPRKSLLERQAAGKPVDKQPISANVDYAFIVQSIDNNFSINRLERYLTICYSAGIEPLLIVSKIDLVSDQVIADAEKELMKRHSDIRYFLVNNLSAESTEVFRNTITGEKTYCVLGSSGVGKSTLINNLLKRNIMKTNEISSFNNKGRHTTEHRQMFVLDNGGIIIDTPGMKELGTADSDEGMRTTFREINNIALRCKFPDCTHNDEKGCAVKEAVDKGIIDIDSLQNYRKILREQERFTTSVAEKHKKEMAFGKMIKEILKDKKKNKF
jgi:ribosome biogenesis GTPase